MTAQDDTPHKEANVLEKILDTLKTIEENTEDILDRFEELMDAREYEPGLQTDSYLNDSDYQ